MCVGGAVVPPILGAVADLHNSTATAMSVPLGFFIGAWSYALCVNFVPSYRIPADKLGSAEIGLKNAPRQDIEAVGGEPEKGGMERAESGSEEVHEHDKY
jgi:MFS transporter, FHS family, L-fucose permease